MKIYSRLASVALLFAFVGTADAQGPSNCAVTTAAPSYGNNQTRALSCDTSGGLRVNASVSATVGTTSTAANPSYVEGSSGNPISSDLTGHLRVIDANSQAILSAVQSSIPAGVNVIGFVTPDPCSQVAKINVNISQTTNTKLVTGTSAKKTYICSIMLVAADAENVSVVAGTGSVCGSGTAGVIGGATAAVGPNLAANGGFAMGGGLGTVASGATNADDICLFQSGSGRIGGVLTYVQQ